MSFSVRICLLMMQNLLTFRIKGILLELDWIAQFLPTFNHDLRVITATADR